MIFALPSVHFTARVQILSLFALVLADLVCSVSTTQLIGRDSIEQQLSVKSARPCSTLDEDDVRSLIGWPKLEKYISDTWAESDFALKINPPNYKDKRASLCIVDPLPIGIKWSGEYECTSSRVEIPPERNTKVVDVKFGYENVGEWNITKVSAAARAELFVGHFKVPAMDFINVGAIDGLGQFVNAPDNSFTTVASNMTYKKTELMSAKDQSCVGTIQEQECRIPSTGRIQLVATGYLWITFGTAKAPVGNPNGGKHKRYALKIEEILKEDSDRSVWIDYEGVMTATTRTDYYNECRRKARS